jgi:hypothetical protein
MRVLNKIISMCLLSALALAAHAEDWSMRWRVYFDAVNGVSFRYPYDYQCPNQYIGALCRGRPSQLSPEAAQLLSSQTEVTRKELMSKFLVDLKVFSLSTSELPTELPGATLEQLGNHFAHDPQLTATDDLTWTSYDYYKADPKRPFADKAWAEAGIEARIGEGAKSCGIIAKHGDEYSALILTGKLSEFDNQAIIDSFEIMAGGGKSGKGKARMTWREAQGKKALVIDGAGKLAKLDAGKNGAVSWANAWELETPHYHVTSHVSPRRLLEYGAFLEALYKAYVTVYAPEAIPPYKMEVHVFNTQHNFMEAAATHGFPVGSGTGGFFVPGLLSIYAFEVMPQGFSLTLNTVLAHECSHQFLHCTCNGSDHVPTWINEGLAVYFESGTFQNNTFSIQPPRERIMILKEYYSQLKRTLSPLDFYLDHHGHISGEAYGEVYAMTHFWVFNSCHGGSCSHKNCGLSRFREYWNALKKGEDGNVAFERIFLADMIRTQGSKERAIAAWQERLLNYVQNMK